jgi:hypothetical protein
LHQLNDEAELALAERRHDLADDALRSPDRDPLTDLERHLARQVPSRDDLLAPTKLVSIADVSHDRSKLQAHTDATALPPSRKAPREALSRTGFDRGRVSWITGLARDLVFIAARSGGSACRDLVERRRTHESTALTERCSVGPRRRRLARFNEERRASDGVHLSGLEHHERGRYCVVC